MTVGERIKERRIALGIRQDALADRLGILKQTLYKYENNIITNISSQKLEAFARELGVSPGYLMGWEEEANTNQASRLLAYAEKFEQMSKEHQETILEQIALYSQNDSK